MKIKLTLSCFLILVSSNFLMAQTYIPMPDNYGLDANSSDKAATPVIEYNGDIYCVSSKNGYNSTSGSLQFFKINSLTNVVTQLTGILPIAGTPSYNFPSNFSVINGDIYFTYNAGLGKINVNSQSISQIHANSWNTAFYFYALGKIFFTDRTASGGGGTYVYDIASGVTNELLTSSGKRILYACQYILVNSKVFFLGEISFTNTTAIEPSIYESTGTNASTKVVLLSGSNPITTSSYINNSTIQFKPILINGNIIFFIQPSSGPYFYCYSFTPITNNSTINFVFQTDGQVYDSFALGGQVYLNKDRTTLYKTNGVTSPQITDVPAFLSGISVIDNPNPFASSVLIYNSKAYGRRYSNTDAKGIELYTTDGTLAGSTLISDINPGVGSSGPNYAIIFNSKMFFNASKDDGTTFNIYQYDGSNILEISSDLKTNSRFFISNNSIFTYGTVGSIGGVYKIDLSTLPISLTKFESNKNSFSEAELKWETSSETNNDYFTLEKSEDGITFRNLTTIKSKGNGNTPLHYQFIDKSPLEGANYYRLSQTDKDGKSTELGIRSVNIQKLAKSEISIYPNPISNNQFTLSIPKLSGNQEIIITDLAGKESIRQKVNFDNEKAEITLKSKIEKGLYLLKVNHTEIVGKIIFE